MSLLVLAKNDGAVMVPPKFAAVLVAIAPVIQNTLIEIEQPPKARLVPVAAPSTGVVSVTFVPSVVAPVMPPKALELLYWSWVLEPPGVPPELEPGVTVWAETLVLKANTATPAKKRFLIDSSQ